MTGIEYKTEDQLTQERDVRLFALSETLRTLRVVDIEPLVDARDLIMLTEYVRAGVIPPERTDG